MCTFGGNGIYYLLARPNIKPRITQCPSPRRAALLGEPLHAPQDRALGHRADVAFAPRLDGSGGSNEDAGSGGIARP